MKNFFILLLFFYANFCHAAHQITLPIFFDNGIPIIKLAINGKSYPFILDTGASDSLYLTDAVASEIDKVVRTGRRVKSFDLTGAIQENDEIVAKNFVANGMSFGDIKGRIRSQWGKVFEETALPPLISVIGISFFENKKVIFDFPERQLTISDDPLITDKKEEWIPLAYHRNDNGIILDFSSEVANYKMVLDSASTISAVNKRIITTEEETGICKLNLGQGNECRYIAINLPAGLSLTPVLTDFPTDFSADGIVGRDFFEQYSIFLDIKNKFISIYIKK